MSDGETETNVNNHQADKTNDADQTDLDSSHPEGTIHTDEREVKRENYRKRKRDQPDQLEQQLERSQTALKSLKKHLDKKTCPKSLQYRARARIRADDDFRRDIKRLRSKAEQDYVQALVRFHNRNIEGLRTAIRQRKGVQANKKTKEHCNQTNSFRALGAQRNCKQKQCNEQDR